MSPTLRAVTLAAGIGCAAIGGVLFAFSAFIMPALGRLPAGQGIAAMQSINITAVRPALMTALFGTAALTVGLAGHALLHRGDRASMLLLVGSGLYLVGTIGLTAGYNVPLNDALAVLDPTTAGASHEWASYLTRWTTANHVRAAAALAAAAALLAAPQA